MRTGIIHLLGMSATLLLGLTLIAWVDSHSHGRIVYYSAKDWTVQGGYNCGAVILSEFRGEGIGNTLGFGYNSIPPNPKTSIREVFGNPWFGIGMYFDRDIGASWRRHRQSGIYVEHWLVVVCSSIPTFLYLRFLYRRRRASREPTPEGSAI